MKSDKKLEELDKSEEPLPEEKEDVVGWIAFNSVTVA